ncbi:YfjI family protein [Rhodoferax sp.]|uniref:YfjI family protein n=1 Tax=Rhodoferax sp. TaxID=50421 RepID=UPI0025EBB64B|nr:YfjI family protein [Rhodoferax sp.]
MPNPNDYAKTAAGFDLAFADLATTAPIARMEWPEPRPIKADLPPAPPFDALALLPKTLADFVLDEADRMPCAPDYVAAALVVALGSVIGTKCAIKPKRRDDWIVTPNLYGGVVGDPSAKKTPAINTVMRFLDRLEAREGELVDGRMKVFEAEKAAFEAHQSAVKAAMKKAAVGKPDPLMMAAAMEDMQNLQEPEEPQPRRFKSNDATTEKLGDLLTHNPIGLLVFRDELIGLLASWDKEGREGDRAFYLEGWNGTGSFNIDRIARGSLFIPCLCLSVFGGIQPDLLERYLSGIATSMDNDGRIQRFQLLVYPDAVPWQWRDRYPVKGAREAVRDLFDRLAAFDPLLDGATAADDFVKLAHYQFDDEAQAVFIEWATTLHLELIAKEQNPLMQQHFGKFEKLFCALALILHLAEGSIGPVKVDSAIRAAAWCEYLAGHARRVYGLVEVGKINTARTLGRRIAEGKLNDQFTARDVWKKGWTGIRSTADAEAALAVLEDYDWVQSFEVYDQPGRPTIRFNINPKTRRAA